jgi:glycosidase
LKDLATERQDVREALVDVFSYWVEQVDIDGFRIDGAKNVEPAFWSYFCPEIRSSAAARGKENFIIFGEIFSGNELLTGPYCDTDRFDSVLYFSSKYSVIENVLADGANTPTDDIYNVVVPGRTTNYNGTPQPGGIGIAPRDCLINFIDDDNFARYLNGNSDAVRDVALGYIFTIPGIPYIYYGTEQGFTGAGEPANREDLWDSGYDTSSTHFQVLKQWTALRGELAPLRRGDFSVRWSSPRTGSSDSDVGIFAFVRSSAGEHVLVIINAHPTKSSFTSYGVSEMDLTPYFNTNDTLQDRLDSSYTYPITDGTESISVPALSIRVLTLQ